MSEPRKVYIVTDGEYSDYHIVAVFSTEELAKEFCGDLMGYEEWDIDELHKTQRPTVHYHVSIGIDNGEFGRTYRNTRLAEYPASRECDVYVPDANVLASRRQSEYPPTINVISKISEDHARKVAIEKRQEFLRTQAEWEKTTIFDAESRVAEYVLSGENPPAIAVGHTAWNDRVIIRYRGSVSFADQLKARELAAPFPVDWEIVE